MSTSYRLTTAGREILDALAQYDPDEGSYGLQLSRDTGRPVGTVYPLLARMELRGILQSTWEDVDPSVVGRPAIRFWRFTAAGAAMYEADVLAQAARLQRAGRVRRWATSTGGV